MQRGGGDGWFTRAEARAAGIGWRALAGPTYRRLFTGVYTYADNRQMPRVAAWAGIGTSKNLDAVASHHTAAELWGAIVPLTSQVHVTVPSDHTTMRPQGLVVHTGDRARVRCRGVPVTSPAQTFVDMGRYLGLVDLVVLVDSLVRGAPVTQGELVTAASVARGRNVRLARRAAGLFGADVDSPMETMTRLLMVLAGLPEPAVNRVIRGDDGVVRRRLDMAYAEARLVIEYDGRQHAESTLQWQRDVGRREDLDGDGWRMMVLLAKDIYRTPARTIDRLRAVMRQVGIPVGEGSEEWRAHFPPR